MKKKSTRSSYNSDSNSTDSSISLEILNDPLSKRSREKEDSDKDDSDHSSLIESSDNEELPEEMGNIHQQIVMERRASVFENKPDHIIDIENKNNKKENRSNSSNDDEEEEDDDDDGASYTFHSKKPDPKNYKSKEKDEKNNNKSTSPTNSDDSNDSDSQSEGSYDFSEFKPIVLSKEEIEHIG